jgi:hypothetical protein
MVAEHTNLISQNVRSDNFRYIARDERGGEQLHELHNLATLPMQTDRMTPMRNRLAAQLKAVTAP